MGSVGFEVEDESLPTTRIGKKCKLPHPTVGDDDGGAVNHGAVPKKRRSDIKKRGRKSVTTTPLPVSKKQRRVSNGFEMLKKDGGKRSKKNMKQGDITKDEEEVAETLYALAAGVFSDASKKKRPGLTDESPEEESKDNVSKLPIVAASDTSNVADTEGKVVELSGSKQKNPQAKDDKNIDDVVFPLPNSSTSEKQTACLRVPDCTNSTPQPLSIKNIGNSEKHAPAQVEQKKLRKRSVAHVHITYLIKDLQASEEKERSLEKGTQAATYGDAWLGSRMSIHNQQPQISGRNGLISLNRATHLAAENELTKIRNDTSPSRQRAALQDQQLVPETSSSAYQCFDFLSLDGSDPNRKLVEAPKQFQGPHVESQHNAAMLFSPSQNGYSAAYHGHNNTPSLPPQQVQQLVNYPGSFSARLSQQLDTQLAAAAESRLMLNYGGAHALYPHLQSKYHQQFLHSQQQQQLMGLHSMALGVSNVRRNLHHFPVGLERNGGWYQESINNIHHHLQLPCNHHPSN